MLSYKPISLPVIRVSGKWNDWAVEIFYFLIFFIFVFLDENDEWLYSR